MNVDSIVALARAYTTRSEFVAKHSTEYSWLSRNKLMHVLDGILPKLKGGRPRGTHTIESVLASAKTCADRAEFHSRFKSEANWLKRTNQMHHLQEVFGEDKRLHKKTVTLASVREAMANYTNRTDFQNNSKPEYTWLKNNNLLHVLDEVLPFIRAEEITEQSVKQIIESCSSRTEFVWNHRKEYFWIRDHNLTKLLDEAFPVKCKSTQALIETVRANAWTEIELMEDAKLFTSRFDWRLTGPDHGYSAAVKRGREFMQKCCSHMPAISRKGTNQTYSDLELLTSARQCPTRNEWKTRFKSHYVAARSRAIWDECVSHMRPAANPFAKDYLIYAVEFEDNHAYVGLTCVFENRKASHTSTGPVFVHAYQTKLTPKFIVCESGLSYVEAGAAEEKWQQSYLSKSWTSLWTAKAGSLGGMHMKWTKESVLAEARKYKTRQEWIDGSQRSYRLAKIEGWFEEACAHMPRRVLGVNAGVPKSPEARQKMREAKLGRKQSAAQRQNRSESVRAWWASRRAEAPSVTSPA